jgi:signal transduction histidine kinase
MKALTGDEHLIRRVLQNLVGNALKFTDKKEGAITVSIEIAAADKVRVSVADIGTGIPRNIVRRYLTNSARWQRANRVKCIRPVSA